MILVIKLFHKLFKISQDLNLITINLQMRMFAVYVLSTILMKMMLLPLNVILSITSTLLVLKIGLKQVRTPVLYVVAQYNNLIDK